MQRQHGAQLVVALALLAAVVLDRHLDGFQRVFALARVERHGQRLAAGQRGIEIGVRIGRAALAGRLGNIGVGHAFGKDDFVTEESFRVLGDDDGHAGSREKNDPARNGYAATAV